MPNEQPWERYTAANRSHTYLSASRVATEHNYRAFFIDFWNKVVPNLLRVHSCSTHDNTAQSVVTTSSGSELQAWVWVFSALALVLGTLLALLAMKYALVRRRLNRLRNLHLIGHSGCKAYL